MLTGLFFFELVSNPLVAPVLAGFDSKFAVACDCQGIHRQKNAPFPDYQQRPPEPYPVNVIAELTKKG